jgi:homospermidine synthase
LKGHLSSQKLYEIVCQHICKQNRFWWRKKYVTFKNRILIIGFGSIGEGTLPLLLRHIDVKPEQISIITAAERGREEATRYGVAFLNQALTVENYRAILEPRLGPGDLLINVSVDVSSVALIELCQEKGVLYVDTCIEPWPGMYTDSSLSPSRRSNYGLRDTALALRAKHPKGSTAVLTHGANPGLVSHFVKQALLNMAKDTGLPAAKPKTSAEVYAELGTALEQAADEARGRIRVIGRQVVRVVLDIVAGQVDGVGRLLPVAGRCRHVQRAQGAVRH